jgi:hypothetical protein
MHDQLRSSHDLETPSAPPDSKDADWQRAVLFLLLGEYPEQLTEAELALALLTDPLEFSGRDALERAVRDLAGAGLLHRHCGFVLPSKAARVFDRLEIA